MVPPTTAHADLTDHAPLPRRALVVEDDEDIRALIEFTLTTQGFQVGPSTPGWRGSRRCGTCSPT